jgi:hypothetical protein
MSEELSQNQQISQELSDEDLEGVAGGSANATAVSNSEAKYGSISISDSKAQALDIDVNKYINGGYGDKHKKY